MHQFFVEPGQISGKRIVIGGPDVNHIKNVLRMKRGDEVCVSCGADGREYRCQIEKLLDRQVVLSLRFVKEAGLELPVRVSLFQGIPKGDKMELVIQKAVELGVYEIIPMAVKRCVVKLDRKREEAKTERWQAICESAAKQAKRGLVPKVHGVMTLDQALSYAQDFECKMIPYELASGMGETRSLIESVRPGQRVAVFIGPEGGFEESEIARAAESGVRPVTLGKRILRTETAGFTVLAWIMYQMEEE